jgi:hypothetical protein
MRNSIMHPLLALAAALCGMQVEAQQINAYRYWFDDNVAAMTLVNLTAAPAVEAALSLNSSSLPPGLHLATIQFKDAEEHWGTPWTSLFVQHGANVEAVQYWFNGDISSAVTTNVTPGPAPLVTGPLASDGQDVGLHHVTLRTRDGSGLWSVPYTALFARNGGLITGYEYWIDHAVGQRTSGTIGPAATVDLLADLPVPTTDGEHVLTIRFRDEQEGWSVPLSTLFTFLVGIDEIPGLSNYLLFPNPVSDRLGLRMDVSVAQTVRFDLLDASGRNVRSLGEHTVQPGASTQWDLSGLAAGSYVLRLTSGGHSLPLPFIKH